MKDITPPEPRKTEASTEGLNNFLRKLKQKRKRNPMKKIFKWIKDTISGDNKTGETVHGILDLFPIPNQIIAKGAKYLFKGQTKEASQELQKLLTVRNAVALVLCIAYFAGWITVDQVKDMVEALSGLV